MNAELAASYEEGSDQILDLIYTDENGTTFVREDGQWVEISQEDEHPTIYDLPLIFVTEEFVPIYDSKDDVIVSDTTPYQVL